MNKELQALLKSDKIEEIEKGLKLSNDKGTVDEIPLICNLLNHPEKELLENSIIELLSSIKIKESNLKIIESIEIFKEKNNNLRALIQVCWQSQLDFTQYLDLFVDVFIYEDYLTALESLTVIENILSDYSYKEDYLLEQVDKLKDKLSEMDEQKILLAKELILVLEV